MSYRLDQKLRRLVVIIWICLLIAGPGGSCSAAEGERAVLVKDFRFWGQTVVPEEKLQALIAHARGQELTLTDLEGLAAKVSAYLRQQGYLTARAYLPAQASRDGTIEIGVILGRYGRIVIDREDKVQVAEAVIRSRLGQVQSGAYIKKQTLEQALGRLQELAGINVSATLSAGAYDGTADLLLHITSAGPTLQGTISTDNYGSRYTGISQTAVFAAMDNPGRIGDRFIFSGMTAGQGLTTASVVYELPAITLDGKINVAYSRLTYELGQEFAGLNAAGTADVLGVTYQHTLRRSRTVNWVGQFGFAAKRLEDKFGETVITNKRNTVITAGIAGSYFDNAGGAAYFSLLYNYGHVSIDNPAARVFDAATLRTGGTYYKWNCTVVKQQPLKDGLQFWLAFNGQLAGKNLDASEKLPLGGPHGVRAYAKGAAAGDTGYYLNAELRWQAAAAKDFQVSLIGFYDFGLVHTNKYPLADAGINRHVLQGAGLGLIWDTPGRVRWQAAYAWKTGSVDEAAGESRAGRAWLQAVKYF